MPMNKLENGLRDVPGWYRTNPDRPPGFASVIRAMFPVPGSVAQPTIRYMPTWTGNDGGWPAATRSASRPRAGLETRNATRNGQNVVKVISGVTPSRTTSSNGQGSRAEKGWSASTGVAAIAQAVPNPRIMGIPQNNPTYTPGQPEP